MTLKPSALSKAQVLSILKAAAYIAASGAISALVSWATNNKDVFGALWPAINVVLVIVKQIFTVSQ